jgi:hypothetical protein
MSIVVKYFLHLGIFLSTTNQKNKKLQVKNDILVESVSHMSTTQ